MGRQEFHRSHRSSALIDVLVTDATWLSKARRSPSCTPTSGPVAGRPAARDGQEAGDRDLMRARSPASMPTMSSGWWSRSWARRYPDPSSWPTALRLGGVPRRAHWCATPSSGWGHPPGSNHPEASRNIRGRRPPRRRRRPAAGPCRAVAGSAASCPKGDHCSGWTRFPTTFPIAGRTAHRLASDYVRTLFHWLGGRRVKANSASPASSRLSATARCLSRHLRMNALRRVSGTRLPPWVFDGEAFIGPGMKDSWLREPRRRALLSDPMSFDPSGCAAVGQRIVTWKRKAVSARPLVGTAKSVLDYT